MIEGVIVVRLDAEHIQTHRIIFLIVKRGWVKHIFHSVLIHRHGLISTGQNVPPTHIFIRGTISVNLVALRFAIAVVVLDRLSHCSEEQLVSGGGRHWIEGNAR